MKLAEKRIYLSFERSIYLLHGDRALLKSLLINLTNNAVDACEPGGHVVWDAYASADGNVLTVTDDGKGIPRRSLTGSQNHSAG